MAMKRVAQVGGVTLLLVGTLVGAWFWREEARRSNPLRGPAEAAPLAPVDVRPTLDPDAIWERAIARSGGRERLREVRRLRIDSQAMEPGSVSRRTRVLYHFPEGGPARYRMETEAFDAELVHAIAGDEAWETLDGVPVRLRDEDVRQLRQQVFMARLSLFVGFAPGELEFEAVERVPGDRLDRLRVSDEAEELGPFELAFAPKTGLMREVAWQSRIFREGSWPEAACTMRLDDYRDVEGIKVPYHATFEIDGEVSLISKVSEVSWAPELEAGLFAAPPAPDATRIKSRRLAARRVLSAEVPEGKDSRPKRLLESLEESGVRRIGPRVEFVRHRDDVLIKEALIVAPAEGTGEKPRDPGEESPVRLEVLAESDAYTLVLSDPSEKREREGWEELRARATAEARKVAPVGRRVIWRADDELVQLQLLLL